MNNTIAFTSRLSIIDPKATEKNKVLYDRITKQFQNRTSKSNFDVHLSRTSKEYDYDIFEVYEDTVRKDIFKLKSLDKIEQLSVQKAVDILIDLLKISEIRMKYNKLIADKQNEIQQLKNSIKQIRQTKEFITRTKHPSDITLSEYYNV